MKYVVQELIQFAGTAITGEDYIAPEDDSKNIANPANYYPNFPEDFSYGGAVFTHEESNSNIPMTAWRKSLVLEFFRWILDKPYMNWQDERLFGFWIFRTRHDKYDYDLDNYNM